MKRLVIHPKDESTVFLKKVYERLENVTLIDGGVEHLRNLDRLIEDHDQVIFLGHGMPLGYWLLGNLATVPLS